MKECFLPPVPVSWKEEDPLSQLDWSALPALSPFFLADGSREARQQTTVRLCGSHRVLYVRFDCQDRDIWGNYTRRDDPIYNEEAVEVFIAPCEADPIDYFEFEVSPNGVLFDALIHNPMGQNNALMTGNASWDCPAIRWYAGQDPPRQHWWAVLAIPWQALSPAAEPVKTWRANFYRIERPHNASPEFSCWSPTLTPVADFHRPSRFGILRLGEARAR